MPKIALTLCASFVYLNLACDVIEPKRFDNDQAKPPQIQTLNIREIKDGHHLAGVFSFTINLDAISSSVRRVDLLVDENLAFSAVDPPFTLTLDTRAWPQREHVISVGVVESRPNIGLLGLVDFPSVIFTATVVFDQTPPTPVVLNSVTLENGLPRLTWSQNTDLNFFAYLLMRESNWGPFDPFGAAIDTIDDRSLTTFLDVPLPQIYGARYTYHVAVSNHAQLAPSNVAYARYGQILDASPASSTTSQRGPRPVLNPVHDEMYIIQPGLLGDTLKAVSTRNNTVVRNLAMTNSPANFAVSKDGGRLYVFADFSPTFMILDATNFNVLSTAEVSFRASSIVAGRVDRLYAATSFPFEGPVKIIDANSGAEVGEAAVNARDGLLAISPDIATLFVANVRSEVSAPAKVYKLNITTDNAVIVAQRMASDIIRAMQLSADGRRLYVLHDNVSPPLNEFVDVWDAATLNFIGRLSIPLAGDEKFVHDMFATASNVYVSFTHDVPEGRYFMPGRVVQFDGASFSALKFWDFVHVPQIILASNDNQFLYAFGFEPWVVTIN